MGVLDVPVWQKDLIDLGRRFISLVREVVNSDPQFGCDLFLIRRSSVAYSVCRLTRENIETVLQNGGNPISLGSMSLHSMREALNETAVPPEGLKGIQAQWFQSYLQLSVDYWTYVRELARHCILTASALTSLHSVDIVALVQGASLAQLRNLASHRLLTFQHSVAYELLMRLAEHKVSSQRLTLAGICCSSWDAPANQALGIGVLA